MSSDREVLLVLVQAAEQVPAHTLPRALRLAIRATRLHLTSTSPHDCSDEVARASAAAYAAGQARNAGASP